MVCTCQASILATEPPSHTFVNFYSSDGQLQRCDAQSLRLNVRYMVLRRNFPLTAQGSDIHTVTAELRLNSPGTISTCNSYFVFPALATCFWHVCLSFTTLQALLRKLPHQTSHSYLSQILNNRYSGYVFLLSNHQPSVFGDTVISQQLSTSKSTAIALKVNKIHPRFKIQTDHLSLSGTVKLPQSHKCVYKKLPHIQAQALCRIHCLSKM